MKEVGCRQRCIPLFVPASNEPSTVLARVFDSCKRRLTKRGVSDEAALKDLPEFARVGEYYLVGQEHSKQGYNASYVYCDSGMMYIARRQMELVKGELPIQANEVSVSKKNVLVYSVSGE